MIKDYDAMLLRINTDHRRLVDEYSFMLLGKDAPKYFKVAKSESQKADFYEILRTAMAGVYEEEEL
jgi:hypothetical protein